MENKEIFKRKIDWINHGSNIRYWYSEIDGKTILLRINDFPDEPLYTLINGLEITDMDDPPGKWNIPDIP